MLTRNLQFWHLAYGRTCLHCIFNHESHLLQKGCIKKYNKYCIFVGFKRWIVPTSNQYFSERARVNLCDLRSSLNRTDQCGWEASRFSPWSIYVWALYSVRVSAQVNLILELAYLLGLQLLIYAQHGWTVSSDTTSLDYCFILCIWVGARINN